jgi:GTPase
MLCVCASSGVQQTTREHLAAALALDIPAFCVITKTDSVHPDVLAKTMRETRRMLATAADSVVAASRDLRGASTDDQSERSVRPSAGLRRASSGDVDSQPKVGLFTSDDDNKVHHHLL